MQKLTLTKLSSITLLSLSMTLATGLAGCQTIKKITSSDNKDKTLTTAEKTEQAYYQEALEDIARGNYNTATRSLNDLRTFYPTGRYAQQALLDLMYIQYSQGNYEDSAASAGQFIRLYPSHPQVDYAYYVRGVGNMAGSSETLRLFKTNQSERDTAIYRLAFANFAELLNKYPNSIYAPDAAQRMTFIYNQFAEHELHVARWYIKRDAYVAAANRAKWIFQYYPQSDSTPEAIAILAYSYEQLGMNDLATEYKTLLQINYPNWLTNEGKVKLSNKSSRSFVNKLTLGKLGRAGNDSNSAVVGSYNGATKTQLIQRANQLQLPSVRN